MNILEAIQKAKVGQSISKPLWNKWILVKKDGYYLVSTNDKKHYKLKVKDFKQYMNSDNYWYIPDTNTAFHL